MATTSSERERETLAQRELEALIREARDRQRRRRRQVALVIAVVAGAGVGVFSARDGRGGHPPLVLAAVASPGAIRAFLARAERAVDGRYSVTYRVTVPQRDRAARAAVVSAWQLSEYSGVYRETPAFSLPEPSSSRPETFVWPIHSYEIFNRTGNPRGIVSCTQRRPSSPWSCLGPDTEIGMGGINLLLGLYPPQALVRGLQNAISTYTGKLAIKPESAFLLSRRVAGREVHCLQFGGMSHPLGSVCLNPQGVIASYQLPPDVTFSEYNTATLQSYSANINRHAFSLPATPKRTYPASP